MDNQQKIDSEEIEQRLENIFNGVMDNIEDSFPKIEQGVINIITWLESFFIKPTK